MEGIVPLFRLTLENTYYSHGFFNEDITVCALPEIPYRPLASSYSAPHDSDATSYNRGYARQWNVISAGRHG
jgi:hypothetical protein